MRVKNKIYHMECFRCVACSKQLLRGEEFALRDDGIFCKADHIILEKAREHYSAENLAVSINTGKPTVLCSNICTGTVHFMSKQS